MTGHDSNAPADSPGADRNPEEVEYRGRRQGPRLAVLVSLLCFAWSVYQLWIASPLPFMLDFAVIGDVPARGIHLAFALLLCFLIYPLSRGQGAPGGFPSTTPPSPSSHRAPRSISSSAGAVSSRARGCSTSGTAFR